MRKITPRNIFWTAVVFGGALGVVLLLTIGLPWAMMEIGLKREYGWSFWRVGHKELDRQIDLSGGQGVKRAYSGPVIGLEGETLVLDYTVVPAAETPAPVTIMLKRTFSIEEPVWKEQFDMPAAGRVRVELGPGCIHQIIIGYRRYLGRVELDWRFESAAPVYWSGRRGSASHSLGR